jgi:hypothetical protein
MYPIKHAVVRPLFRGLPTIYNIRARTGGLLLYVQKPGLAKATYVVMIHETNTHGEFLHRVKGPAAFNCFAVFNERVQ